MTTSQKHFVHVASALLLGGLTASAQVNNWTGGGADDLWTTGANWSQGTELDGSDTGGGWLGSAGGGVSTVDAPYNRSQLYTVIVNDGHTVTQNGGYVQTRSGSGGQHVYIGDSVGPGTWIVNGGDLETEGNSIRMGRFDGTAGTLVQTGGGINVRGTLGLGGGGGNFGTSSGSTGTSGAGTFLLQGGTFRNNGSSFIGWTAGSTGYLEQSGGDSIWTGGQLNIGQQGDGTYVFSNGTITSSREFRIGTASGGNGTFQMSGGTWNASNSIYTGYANGATGHFDLSGGLVDTTSGFRVAEAGDGTVIQSGGTIRVGGTAGIPMGLTATADAVWQMTGGAIEHTGVSPILLGEAGRATMNISGTASVDSASSMILGRSGGVGTVNQSAGSVSVSTLDLVGTGSEYNLDGGTLGVNTIGVASGTTFNWGAATLTTRSNEVDGTVDTFSSPGFSEVKVGTELDVTGSISSSATGSTLALGGLFINNGVRFNQMTVTDNLTLGGSDTLTFDVNPYLLRPNVGTAIEYGSLPLVDVAGTLTGTFATFDGVVSDAIGWAEYTGVFTDAASLPVNTWYLEQDAGAGEVIFHFKVEGTVPEPGTMGLLGLGILVLRRVRLLRRRQVAAAEHGPDWDPIAARGFYG